MKFGFKHVAIAAVLAFGAISAAPATVQAQLAPALQQQVNDALAEGGGDAAAVLAGRPDLAASIGAQMATVVSASTALTPAQKAAQIQAGSQALAAANQAAAAATIAAIAGAAPAFQQNAITGGVAGAPTQAAAIVQAGTTAGGGGTGGDGGGGAGAGAGGDEDGGETPPGSLS